MSNINTFQKLSQEELLTGCKFIQCFVLKMGLKNTCIVKYNMVIGTSSTPLTEIKVCKKLTSTNMEQNTDQLSGDGILEINDEFTFNAFTNCTTIHVDEDVVIFEGLDMGDYIAPKFAAKWNCNIERDVLQEKIISCEKATYGEKFNHHTII